MADGALVCGSIASLSLDAQFSTINRGGTSSSSLLQSFKECQVDGVHEGAQVLETGAQMWERHELEPGQEVLGDN